MLLDIIGMARSTFYYNLSVLKKPDVYADVRARICEIYSNHKGRYGYRRITIQLRQDGLCINHKLVQKLMGQMHLRGLSKKRHYHSYKGEVGKVAPNVLERDFKANSPNEKWTTDLTQVNIHNRIIYLSPILDMYNGEIVSYAISRSPDLELVKSMLLGAFEGSGDLHGLILHSDQGWQYRHGIYRKMLRDKGIVQSMSRKGNCLDNAMMESFFHTMKDELLYLRKWKSVEEFEEELKKYIHYYNNDRIKLRLNGMSPVKYRTQCQIHKQ